jgi:hypothetical protein
MGPSYDLYVVTAAYAAHNREQGGPKRSCNDTAWQGLAQTNEFGRLIGGLARSLPPKT